MDLSPQSNSAERITALLSDIRDHLEEQSADKRLWSYDDLARYFNRSPDHIRKKVVRLKGFPKPIYLPSETAAKSHPLYNPSEVKEWAIRQR